MPVSTIAVLSLLGLLAAAQQLYNMPATIKKETAQAERQAKHDAVVARQKAEREAKEDAKLYSTPEPEEVLPRNTWTPSAPGVLVEITPEPDFTPTPLQYPEVPPEITVDPTHRIRLDLQTWTPGAENFCYLRALARGWQSFTCQIGETVIIYFQDFPLEGIMNGTIEDKDLRPTWVNQKEIGK